MHPTISPISTLKLKFPRTVPVIIVVVITKFGVVHVDAFVVAFALYSVRVVVVAVFAFFAVLVFTFGIFFCRCSDDSSGSCRCPAGAICFILF